MLFPGVNVLSDFTGENFIWINESSQLASLCKTWQAQAVIALDTEFIREKTFYPIIGLIQIGDENGQYLLDPLADIDFEPFKSLLTDKSVMKIFHSCSEDLDVFARFAGVIPTPVFDTQIAAAYCGYGTQMGYQRLVQALFDIELDKHETRSNWLQRPLTESQQRYAAEDVYYLLAIHRILSQRLDNLGRTAWVIEENQALLSGRNVNKNPEKYYLKFRNASHFSKTQQRALQLLCAWREAEAQQTNRPRGHVLRESSLLPIAEALPEGRQSLLSIQGVSVHETNKYEAVISVLMKEARALSADAQFDKISPPLKKESKPLQSALKKVVAAKALALELPADLLLRRKTMEALMLRLLSADEDWKNCLRGWRYEVLGEQLEHEIARHQVLLGSLRNSNKVK